MRKEAGWVMGQHPITGRSASKSTLKPYLLRKQVNFTKIIGEHLLPNVPSCTGRTKLLCFDFLSQHHGPSVYPHSFEIYHGEDPLEQGFRVSSCGKAVAMDGLYNLRLATLSPLKHLVSVAALTLMIPARSHCQGICPCCNLCGFPSRNGHMVLLLFGQLVSAALAVLWIALKDVNGI
uniref:Uncharacterized protein n=1 Tax=Sphaerodactylus townsendi TaxID=933632 RepID=A0ACB8FDJ2_9SAUR